MNDRPHPPTNAAGTAGVARFEQALRDQHAVAVECLSPQVRAQLAQRRHDGHEAWSAISDALRKLPARQREAFTLRVLEDLDVSATAMAMGCSEGSVKTHLSRARVALQRQLEEFR